MPYGGQAYGSSAYASVSGLTPASRNIRIEVAFTSNPVGGSYAWVDVTNYARKVKIKRGRQHILGKFEPGTATILFNARDGALDPTNPSSPYWPNVDINRRVRVLAGPTSTPIYTGFVDAWTPLWPNNVSSDVEMTATDGLRLLARDNFTTSGYVAQVIADGAHNLVPFSDTVPSGQGPSPLTDTIAPSSAYPWLIQPPYAVGQTGTSFVDLAYSTTLTGGSMSGAYVSGHPKRCITSVSDFSVEIWAQWTDTTANRFLWAQFSAQESLLGIVTDATTPGGLKIVVDEQFGNGWLAYSPATEAFNDGVWHHIVLTCSTGSGPTYSLYVDGVLESNITRTRTMASGGFWGATTPPSVTYVGALVDSFWSGPTLNTVELVAWTAGWSGSVANLALYGAGKSLSAAKAQIHYALGLTGFVVEDSGARITHVLSDVGWPVVDQTISTGLSQVQTPTASMVSTSILSYMQQVEDAEHGSLFASGAGKVTFLNRYANLGQTSVVTLGERTDLGEIPFKPGPTFALDNIDHYNASHVDRAGGTIQVASDATSTTKYGMTSVLTESGLLTTSDADSLARAQWNVAHFAYPLPRMQAMTVDVYADFSNRFTQIALRELRDRVTVHRRPYATPAGLPSSPTFAQDSTIEGIEHQIDENQWLVTLRCSPAEIQSYWILGDAVNGVLSSTTRLAYLRPPDDAPRALFRGCTLGSGERHSCPSMY